ncbi:hypothetical protein HDU96_004249 [Phlyctochytrium bullatum]|nr:hypothetical protein HDU96_004249 [Phlyctochytrium bullatum]
MCKFVSFGSNDNQCTGFRGGSGQAKVGILRDLPALPSPVASSSSPSPEASPSPTNGDATTQPQPSSSSSDATSTASDSRSTTSSSPTTTSGSTTSTVPTTAPTSSAPSPQSTATTSPTTTSTPVASSITDTSIILVTANGNPGGLATPRPNSDPVTSPSVPTGAILGGVAAALLVLAGGVVGAVLYRKRRRARGGDPARADVAGPKTAEGQTSGHDGATDVAAGAAGLGVHGKAAGPLFGVGPMPLAVRERGETRLPVASALAVQRSVPVLEIPLKEALGGGNGPVTETGQKSVVVFPVREQSLKGASAHDTGRDAMLRVARMSPAEVGEQLLAMGVGPALVAALEDNGIDGSRLFALTEADLVSMGIGERYSRDLLLRAARNVVARAQEQGGRPVSVALTSGSGDPLPRYTSTYGR